MSLRNPLYQAFIEPREADGRAFLILPNGEEIRFRDAMTTARRLAHVLVDAGVKPGERVAVQVEKSPEALLLYLACAMAGGVFLPLNTAYTDAEVDYFVTDAEPALVVCDPAREETLTAIAAKTGATARTLAADGSGSLAAAAEGAPPMFDPAPRARDDLAAILYTSGTTGRSKGAMLSHGNLLSNAEALVSLWRFTAEDVLLHALPIFHTHGLFVASNVMLSAGGSMIFLPKFDQNAVLAALPRATSMMGVPTFYTRLLDDPRFTAEAAAHMRLFISGSAPLLAQTHIEFEERTGHRILERYGMSETGMITSNPYEGARRAGTVGFALPGVEVRIADPDSGALLPQGEIGVIEVKGPNVFQGYWRMPEKTKAEMREDGFFITGDLGVIDAQGYLSIVGRGKDLIISGGFNVYPKEVEAAIDDIDGVEESAVIGAPHPDFGEGVVAVVVADGAGVTAETVSAGVSGRLAKFKQPKQVFLVDALPRNSMGKVQKKALRERYEDVFKR